MLSRLVPEIVLGSTNLCPYTPMKQEGNVGDFTILSVVLVYKGKEQYRKV